MVASSDSSRSVAARWVRKVVNRWSSSARQRWSSTRSAIAAWADAGALRICSRPSPGAPAGNRTSSSGTCTEPMPRSAAGSSRQESARSRVAASSRCTPDRPTEAAAATSWATTSISLSSLR